MNQIQNTTHIYSSISETPVSRNKFYSDANKRAITTNAFKHNWGVCSFGVVSVINKIIAILEEKIPKLSMNQIKNSEKYLKDVESNGIPDQLTFRMVQLNYSLGPPFYEVITRVKIEPQTFVGIFSGEFDLVKVNYPDSPSRFILLQNILLSEEGKGSECFESYNFCLNTQNMGNF